MEISIKSEVEEDGNVNEYLFIVNFEGKSSGALSPDELLGLIASLTMPKERPCLRWLRTPDQETKYQEFLKSLSNKKEPSTDNDDDF